ncbi:DNA polymerase III subunit delta [Porcipelethomonas sp.]|uniref:DNA polymerase III subunit delta n=1 Tax=Porcipelethomonas sp. TaxID=2981675 RepID=UPI003EFAACE8
MAEINAMELLKKIKSGELPGIYYIYGRDVMTVEETTRAILKKYLGKNWRENVNKIDGKNIDISSLLDIMEISPMFAEYNAIVINDLNAEELSADKINQLTDALNTLPEYTVVIFNITGFDVKNGKKYITGKNKKLADCISKKGLVCECGLKTMTAVVKSITDKAQKYGCSISRTTAQKLAEYCLMDSMQINNELEKLCSYRENQEIRPEDVDRLVSGQIETDSFKLARAVTSLNAGQAFVLLDDLLDKRNEPVAVLSAISMAFLDLYRARAAMTVNKRPNDIISDFNYKGREFAVNNAYRDCRKISLENIRKCICILRDTDRKLKQSPVSQKIILEKALTEMIIAARR